MAKNPRKVQDPTQAALSAIEDALHMASDPPPGEPAVKDDDAVPPEEPRRAPREAAPPPMPPVAGAHADEPVHVRRRPPHPGRRMERAAQAPANDDRQSVGQVLAALHARPPRAPYVIATLASLWWIAMAAMIGYSRSYDDIAQTSGLLEVIDLPNFWLFFATVVLPPALFFTIAALIRRSQEMRLVSQAMTEVTLRLAEPEGVSTDAVVSVSQAIRREVAALGDGIERAIARASELETMVRNEVATLERAYDENELRIRSLVDELQSERDSIVSHGTRLREAIGGAHENFSLDVEGVAGRIDATLTEATDRINAALAESGNRITENFLQHADTIRTRAEEAGNTVLDSFAIRSADISDTISRIGNEIGSVLDSRAARAIETLNASAERVTEELVSSMDRSADAIAAKGAQVHNLLHERLSEAEAGIARNGGEIADRISADTASLAERISTDTAALAGKVSEGLRTFDETVKVHGTGLVERLTQTIGSLDEHTRGTLTSFDERTGGKLQATTEALDARIARIEQTIDSRAEKLNETLANRTLELARTIADSAKIAGEAVDKTVAGMGEYFADKAQEIALTISDRAEVIDQTLGQRALEMTENLDSRIRRFEEQVSDKLAGITTSIETKGLALADALGERIDGATANLRRNTTEAEQMLTDRIDSVSNLLRTDAAAFEQALTSRTEKVGKALRDDIAYFEQTLAGRADKISKALRDDVAFVDQTLGTKMETIGKLLRKDVAEFDQSLAAKAENVGRILRDDVAVLDHALSGKTAEIGRQLRDDIGVFEHALSTRTAEVGKLLRDDIALFDQALANRTAEVGRLLRDDTTLFDQTLSTKTADIGRLLRENIGQYEQAITAKSDAVSKRLRDDVAHVEQTLGARVEAIGKALHTGMGRIDEALGTRAEVISRKLRDSATEAEQILSARAASFTESVRADSASIEMALTELTARVSKTLVERVVESTAHHQALRNEIVSIVEGIGKAHKLLTGVLEETVTHLRPMENAVAERITAFQETLEQAMASTRGVVDHMDNQMRGARDVSIAVVRDIGALTQRFEEQGRLIAGTAGTLQETHRRIDQTLSERRESIEGFANLLANRTTDIEQRLAHFTRLLDEALGGAEERAHEIAKLVAESTAQSTTAIAKQYDLMRTGTEEERVRTANLLRAAYDQTMEEVKGLFGDARQRFHEAAGELRVVAEEVHEQLEQTRAELKRGVLELPHETRESAEAMRRVVTDQLKALAELNEIVARHAREMEVVEPHRIQSAAQAGGARFAGHAEGASVTELPGRPRAAEPRGEPIEFRRPQRPGPRAVAPAEHETQGEGERGGGWLSGLLGSSGEAEDRLPAQTVESLDSLSLDIARMIDHDAAVELWERHRRGERNIFTRRLYTPQGQKTFDEIRRRYKKNSEFRETVDRYIDEFERLLEQVSRDDRGQALSRTYLTSDTGKVYTILAHAAARLN